MSMMHSQISRAITTAIAERVIPQIQKIANSMSFTGHRDTEASMSPNIQENKKNASGPKIKIAKKDSWSVDDLRAVVLTLVNTIKLKDKFQVELNIVKV